MIEKCRNWFFLSMAFSASVYICLILVLVLGNVWVVSFEDFLETIFRPEIHHSIVTTLLSCSVSTFLAMFFGMSCAYFFSRYRFRGKSLLEAIVDIPLILPPIVVGLCLLIVFNKLELFGESIDSKIESFFGVPVTFRFGAIVLAQFVVTASLVVQLLRPVFDMVPKRNEEIAMLFGASRRATFFGVLLAEAKPGVMAAATLAWIKAFGEFGPILVFAGSIRGRTEVLSTSVFLELNTGNLGGAMAVALLMIAVSVFVVFLVKRFSDHRKKGGVYG